LAECKRAGIEVLGPDINESELKFTVNKKGQIRFGLMALKGVGEGPIEAIVAGRQEEAYKSVFDFVRRVNLRSVNKKAMESLAYGGGFDFYEDMNRAQYFAPSEKYDTFITHLLKYGNAHQSQAASAANSLFGAMAEEIAIPEPKVPECEEWGLIKKLNEEKAVVGLYLSGHPLDDFAVEMQNYTTCGLDRIDEFKDRQINVGGIVTLAIHRISQKGTGWGIMKIEDFKGSLETRLFGEDYIAYKNYMNEGEAIYVSGTYKQRWKGTDYDLKISKVQLLETVGQDKTESITVSIDVNTLSNQLVPQLDTLCTKYEGKHKFKVILIDKANRIKLDMYSKGKKVNADSIFINEITSLGLEYKLNK
jgi:DNA polymerase-3 subunit alpha